LLVSSQGVYSPHPDPLHLYNEADPIGRAATPYAPTSPATKVGMEAVGRFCARAFNLPVTIARLNTVFGVSEAHHTRLVDAILAGDEWSVPGDPNPHSPIHVADMGAQIEALLDAAGVPALTTNWCGDELVFTHDFARRISELSGKRARLVTRQVAGAPSGNANDPTRRRSITGPCQRPISAEIDALYAERAGARRGAEARPAKTVEDRVRERGW